MARVYPVHGYRTTESSPYNLAMTEADYLIDDQVAYGSSDGSFIYNQGVTWGLEFSESTSCSRFVVYFSYVGYEFLNPTSTVSGWSIRPSVTHVLTSPDGTEDSWTEVDVLDYAVDGAAPWLPISHVSIDENVGGEIWKTGKFALNLSTPISAKFFKIKFSVGAGGGPSIIDTATETSNCFTIREIEAHNDNVTGDGEVEVQFDVNSTGLHGRNADGNTEIDCSISGIGLTGVIGSGSILYDDVLVSSYCGARGSLELDPIRLLGSGISSFFGNCSIFAQMTVTGHGYTGFVGYGAVDIDLELGGTLYFDINADGEILLTINKVRGWAVCDDWLGIVLRYDDRWIMIPVLGDANLPINLLVDGGD